MAKAFKDFGQPSPEQIEALTEAIDWGEQTRNTDLKNRGTGWYNHAEPLDDLSKGQYEHLVKHGYNGFYLGDRKVMQSPTLRRKLSRILGTLVVSGFMFEFEEDEDEPDTLLYDPSRPTGS